MLGEHTEHGILWRGTQPFELRSGGYVDAKAVKEKQRLIPGRGNGLCEACRVGGSSD